MGRSGIVLGLEVSRLARNNADWHRLLELAALSHTLILDEDGIYDPAHFNDRLLLGLKGAMSEAELQNSYVDTSDVRGMKCMGTGFAAETKYSRSKGLESVRFPSTAKD